jgi:putative ABC transport system permease protein
MFRRKRMLDDLDRDIRDHIARETQDNIDRGMQPDEARYAALRKFGNVARIKEDTREVWISVWFEQLLQDTRFGLRTLRTSPGFTIIAILTLALGIGANSAIFSAVNSILLKPLPYPDSSRLVEIQASDLETGGCPLPDFLRIQAESKTIGPMALHAWGPRPIMTGAGAPERVNVHDVSADFFPLFAIQPLLGRWFVRSEMQAGNERVVVLGYPLWRDSFGSDTHVIGRTITLKGEPYEIVGVMPPQFDFPKRHLLQQRIQMWAPLVPTPEEMTTRNSRFMAIARIRPGHSMKEVQNELGVISSHLQKSDPKVYKSVNYSAVSVKEKFLSGWGTLLLMLLISAGFVLLIVCANLANLSLARGFARRPELAVRATLGASRLRLIRQLLVESLLLALMGGASGLLLGYWGVAGLRLLLPSYYPRIDELRMDRAALWFTLGMALFAAILFGLAPALIVSRQNPNDVMKEGGSRSSGALASHRGRWFRDLLVTGEVALAFVLVLGTVLTLRSFSQVLGVSPGFRTDHLLIFEVPRPASIPNKDFDAKAFSRELFQRLREIPGMESVTGWEGARAGWRASHIQGIPDSDLASLPGSEEWYLAPNYFSTLGIAEVAGRDFSDADTQSSPLVAIVNREFARQRFGNVSPVGKHLTLRSLDPADHSLEKDCQIVGEVGNVRSLPFRGPSRPALYLDYDQYVQSDPPSLLVRTAVDPQALEPAIRAQVTSVWKDDPVENMQTVDQITAFFTSGARSRTVLLGTFGALGLLLAALGIYGVMSYSVVQRTHEVGVRMALGAESVDVMRLIVGQGARVALVGVAVGVGCAWALTRFLRSVIVEIDPRQIGPLMFAGVAILLLVVALLACYIPARRAMRVDPMIALRHE